MKKDCRQIIAEFLQNRKAPVENRDIFPNWIFNGVFGMKVPTAERTFRKLRQEWKMMKFRKWNEKFPYHVFPYYGFKPSKHKNHWDIQPEFIRWILEKYGGGR